MPDDLRGPAGRREPRAEARSGAREASRRFSVAPGTKSPGGTTRQYSARDGRERSRTFSFASTYVFIWACSVHVYSILVYTQTYIRVRKDKSPNRGK